MHQTLTSWTEGRTRAVRPSATGSANPWHALWAMMVGFFMILLDATIVAVANPSIMVELGADYDAVIWVTSAYLLGFAVPLLVAGRLGDQFGPKNLYIVGLAIFTAASLWCGLAGSIEMLIAARVVQGMGAAALTPQTLSMITRIFPAQRRGAAMAVWGATAGVATLVGPLAGGVLVDALGWSWIFFVNVPVGLVGLALAVWLIPTLPTQMRRFDLPGVLLSGIGIFLIVFALQEGQANDWAPWIWGTATIGLGFIAAFVYWQSINNDEPLIPLRIFADRDFGLSTVGVAAIGFVATSQVVPLMFYAQAVCGLSPTRSAVLIAPMAIASGVLAPLVGRIIDRSHPRPVIGFGFAVLAVALTWLSIEMTATTPIWRLVLPITAMGIGMAFIWSPLAATATRNLTADVAGAGSGVYNATRQVGSVLGSAGIAAFLTFRVTAEMPAAQTGGPVGEAAVTELPAGLQEPFAAAMSQSMLLPAFLALFGVVAALFLLGFGDDRSSAAAAPDDEPTDIIDLRELSSEPAYYIHSRGYRMPVGDDHLDDYVEDEFIETDEFDDYLEYTVLWDDLEPEPEPVSGGDVVAGDDSDTEPIALRAEHLMHVPGDPWHKQLGHEPREPAAPPPIPEQPAGLLDELLDKVVSSPSVEPIGHAHNGFHVDEKKHFQPLPRPEPPSAVAEHYAPDIADDTWDPGHIDPGHIDPGHVDFGHFGIDDRPGRHQLPDERAERGRHSSSGRHARSDPDDNGSYGRHSKPD